MVTLGSTLAQNARDVCLIPALGTIFPIFITTRAIAKKTTNHSSCDNLLLDYLLTYVKVRLCDNLLVEYLITYLKIYLLLEYIKIHI